MGYSRTALKGFGWLGTVRLITRGLSYLKLAIIARFLLPQDFGIFGIVALSLAFFETLTETGVNMALIHKDKALTQNSVDTSFIISIVRGILISTFMALLSWPIASFFKEPRVVPFLLVASLISLVRGFINPAEISFQKNLEFNKESWFRIILAVIDIVTAIGFTLLTKSVLALVLSMLITSIAEVGLSWWWCRPTPRLKLNRAELHEILHFGKWLNITVVANYFATQLDSMVVGRFLGTQWLGIYQLGFKLAYMPLSEVGAVISQATFPIMTKIAHDPQRSIRAFWRSFWLVALTSAILVLPFIFTPQLIVWFLGKQWHEVILLLPLLALAAYVRGLITTTSPVFLAWGQTRALAIISFIRLIGIGLSLIILSSHGVIGVALAVLLSNIVSLPVTGWLLYTTSTKKLSTVNTHT